MDFNVNKGYQLKAKDLVFILKSNFFQKCHRQYCKNCGVCWNSRSLALMQMFGRARALPTVLRYLIDKIAHLHGFLLTMHVSFKPDWARNPESPHSSVRLITLPCENNIFVIFAIRKVWCIIWYARILGAIFFGTFCISYPK